MVYRLLGWESLYPFHKKMPDLGAASLPSPPPICQNLYMRLTPAEQQIIREAALSRFGVRPRLFGSRVDDTKRGGDIDLYIEAQMSAKEAFDREMHLAADLYLALGDQKIDIVVNTGRLDLPIYQVARTQGVLL